MCQCHVWSLLCWVARPGLSPAVQSVPSRAGPGAPSPRFPDPSKQMGALLIGISPIHLLRSSIRQGKKLSFPVPRSTNFCWGPFYFVDGVLSKRVGWGVYLFILPPFVEMFHPYFFYLKLIQDGLPLTMAAPVKLLLAISRPVHGFLLELLEAPVVKEYMYILTSLRLYATAT